MKHKRDLIRITSIVNEPTNWLILPERYSAILDILDSYKQGRKTLATEEPELEAEITEDIKRYTINGNTAVIGVEGTILAKAGFLETMCGAFSLQTFQKDLKELAVNPEVQNIVINFDTPGGTVTQLPETADLINSISKSKNVIAYSSGIIASAGYFLASQANRIYISKSAWVGSIGTIAGFVDVSEKMKKEGVKVELFKSGKYKGAGFDGSLTDEQRELKQANIDKLFNEFKSYVRLKRNVDDESMQGQMFDSEDGIKNGLIDGVVNDLDALVSYLNTPIG